MPPHSPPDLGGPDPLHTAELGEIEAKIANAGDRALGLELEISSALCHGRRRSDDLRAAAHAFALLDVAIALAKLAVDDNTCGPRSMARSASPSKRTASGGRQALKRDGQPFIANACDLSPAPGQTSGQIWLLTAPTWPAIHLPGVRTR